MSSSAMVSWGPKRLSTTSRQGAWGTEIFRAFAGHHPTRGSGQEGFKMSRVRSGRFRRCSKCNGLGRVKSFLNLTGRAGS